MSEATLAPAAPPRRRLRRDGRGALWLGLLLPLCFAALTLLQLWELREDAWDRAERGAQNLLLALGQDIERQIDIYDRALAAVARNALLLREEDLADSALLFAPAAATRHLGSMTLLDATGQAVASSDPSAALHQDLSARAIFLRHRLEPELGLLISPPYQDGTRDGYFLALSRALRDERGGFAGVVLGTLQLSYMRQLAGGLSIGPHSTINLFNAEGLLLYREPMGSGRPGMDLSQAPTVRRMLADRAGQFVGHAALDGVERLYTHARLGNYPLVLNVALATGPVLAAWQENAVWTMAMVALLCLATLLLGLRLQRELRRRRMAEAAARAESQRYHALAETDALTGLGNRRKLDRLLRLEWERQQRLGQPLALVMLDIDHFKAFNDSQGHLAGDAVLRSLAGCIRSCIRAETDLAARYGGEEFAILLPGGADEARHLAERIQDTLYRLNLPHPAARSGRVSVSLGAAAMVPPGQGQPAMLLQAADAALYRAKQAGRDQVAMAA
ncbi:diguanylate cyclase [Pseudoroseomonas cervicalis]|uniref:GGDEF domain-containing protein n=1 Tax=Teichococcus cervicalis TaxID=204525 RepID=UPI0022F14985|nr:sensor domain-containing diguanylate cyclase [Pseudoroseomonas cervicalis]WBV41826.1 sensor domain-containing diguanylate cyclase [Pseudoroseomonas cervicalis]